MDGKEICCSCKKMTVRIKEEKNKNIKIMLQRVKMIDGQVKGICGMVERNAYCTYILMQSAAVNAAINAFNKELIGNHIKGCVARDLRQGKEEVVDELITALQKLMK